MASTVDRPPGPEEARRRSPGAMGGEAKVEEAHAKGLHHLPLAAHPVDEDPRVGGGGRHRSFLLPANPMFRYDRADMLA